MDPPKAKPSHPTEQAYPDSDFKPLTKAEVQKFLEQQAFHLGELGFASNFTEFKDVCALWERKLEGAASEQSTEPMMTETDGEGRAVHEAMTSVQSTLLQLKERNRLLEDPRNKAVISEAEAEIDQLLFDAGKTKGYVTSSQLRRKVVDVMEIPCPRVAANFTNMLVHVPGTEPSKNDILEINMPLRSAIEDVYHMLDEFVRAQVSYVTGFVSPDDGDPFSGRESSGWKYQLVTRSRRKVLGTASIKLDTDSDYCDLIRKITTGPKPPVAILTNVSLTHNGQHFHHSGLTISGQIRRHGCSAAGTEGCSGGGEG